MFYDEICAAANRRPDAVAVVSTDGLWTYQELTSVVDRVSDVLSSWVGGACIGLMLGRSRLQYAAVLAALSLGVPFVQLDTALPSERLRWLATDAGCPVIVRAPGVVALDLAARDVVLDVSPASSSQGLPTCETRRDVGNGCAAIIYTSGTTGRPVGVMLSRRGILNRLSWSASEYPLTEDDRVLGLSAPSFDFSLWEIIAPLAAGATAVLASSEMAYDPSALASFIGNSGITVAHFVPSVLWPVINACPEPLENVRLVLVGGEQFTVSNYRLAKTVFPNATFYNQYGPTETTIDSTFYQCGAADLQEHGSTGGVIPIGRAISNTTTYVLTLEGTLAGPGEIGELHIGGDGVSLGYINRPDLTNERFLSSSTVSEAADRLYRTGDIVKIREKDLLLEFVGRADEQVKIRGVRVDPGEVTEVLRMHPGVQNAAVLASRRREQVAMIAFVITNSDSVTPELLREALAAQLPQPMIPEQILVVPGFPLLHSGKLDRRSLLSLAEDAGIGRAEWDGAGSEEENLISDIWASLLAVPRPSPEMDFFELGGHSLVAMEVVRRIEAVLGVPVPLRLIFSESRLGGLAKALKEIRTT